MDVGGPASLCALLSLGKNGAVGVATMYFHSGVSGFGRGMWWVVSGATMSHHVRQGSLRSCVAGSQ
jgi:hypothetical protein